MISADAHQEDEILGKAYDSRLMARVLRYLSPYRRLLLIAFALLMLQTGAQLLGPYITKIAIDRYIAEKDVGGLDLMALAYIGVVIFGFVVLFAQTYATQYIGQRAMHDLRRDIFSHLQKMDMASARLAPGAGLPGGVSGDRLHQPFLPSQSARSVS